MTGFNVTYEIVTPESAEDGEAAELGFIAEGVTLREALEFVSETRTSHVGGVHAIEANEYPVRAPRWITVSNGMEFMTGAYESRALHFPDSVTGASRRRVARLMGCYGVAPR